jgi:hypothetical protein
MTVPSSGDRMRRGGRRPGWALLTVLLVLAIAASTALVFTNKVELLKLAVILALWAAVVGAFASVIYRRQSDVDAARARDMKLVYDLQLDREIAARREYELGVEANLRRELAGEIRGPGASDEVALLRAELASLRRSLEVLFDADLSQRPAIETDRSYGEWPGTGEPARVGRVASSRVNDVRATPQPQTAENPIIDVPEEPLLVPEPAAKPVPEPAARGSHRRRSEDTGRIPLARPGPAPVVTGPAPQPRVAPLAPPPVQQPPPPVQQPPPPPVPPPPAPTPEPVRPVVSEPVRPVPPAPTPEPVRPPAPEPVRPAVSEPVRPVSPEPVRPAAPAAANGRTGESGRRRRPEPAPEPDRRGRHSGPTEAPAPPYSPPVAARHRGADEPGEDTAAPAGQSVAELLARLQQDSPAQGGRRRRRED